VNLLLHVWVPRARCQKVRQLGMLFDLHSRNKQPLSQQQKEVEKNRKKLSTIEEQLAFV
jgi:hypothetical protein